MELEVLKFFYFAMACNRRVIENYCITYFVASNTNLKTRQKLIRTTGNVTDACRNVCNFKCCK